MYGMISMNMTKKHNVFLCSIVVIFSIQTLQEFQEQIDKLDFKTLYTAIKITILKRILYAHYIMPMYTSQKQKNKRHKSYVKRALSLV